MRLRQHEKMVLWGLPALATLLSVLIYLNGAARMSLMVVAVASLTLTIVPYVGMIGYRHQYLRAGLYISAMLLSGTMTALLFPNALTELAENGLLVLVKYFYQTANNVVIRGTPVVIAAFFAVPIIFVISLVLSAMELFTIAFRQLDDDHGKRRRSKSDLFGNSDFLSKKELGNLSSETGIILGQYTQGGVEYLFVYPLVGGLVSYAPPREGKTATKIINYVNPYGLGHQGPILDIDPRGEAFFVCSRKRRLNGRDVILMDPFAHIRKLKDEAEKHGDEIYAPFCTSAQFNPLDLIREGEEMVGDIDMLLEGLLEPPKNDGAGNAMHFFQSMQTLLRGLIAYVRFRNPPGQRTLYDVFRLLILPDKELKKFAKFLESQPDDLYQLPALAGGVLSRVGDGEGGSNYTTYVNSLKFLTYPAIKRNMSRSTFDPLDICRDKMDIFIVMPEEHLEAQGPWLRLWATMASICVNRLPPEKNILAVVDEMAAMGRLQKMISSFNMAAGNGLHYWAITQAESTFDRTYGDSTREVITDLAEVIQILGVPRKNKKYAEEISEAIGHATYEQTMLTEGTSGKATSGFTSTNSDISVSDGRQITLVKGSVMSPEQIMQLPNSDQIVLASPHSAAKQAMYLQKVRYWEWPEIAELTDPNPYEERKKRAKKEDHAA